MSQADSRTTPPGSPSPASSPERRLQAETAFRAGMAAHQKGDLDHAVRAYNDCLALWPAHAQAINNLAVALRKQNRQAMADACYRRSLAVDPANTATLVNHGNVLRDLGRYEDAERQYKTALTLHPDNRGAWYGLGLIYRDMKRLTDSIAALEHTLTLTPDDPDVLWDLSHSLLCAGEFRRGMALYESRWRLKDVRKPRYPWPEWDGQTPIGGKTLLLYGEQGFGDVLQFVRFIPLLTARKARVVLQVREPLIPLLQNQFPGVVRLLSRDQPVPRTCCDMVAPLMSVPHLLDLTADDIPRSPYLRPPDGEVHLPAATTGAALKIGLCWQGSPTHKNDHNRSMPFAALAPLISRPFLALFSLQKGPAAAQPMEYGVDGLVRVLDPHLKSFAETAAAIDQMDLVISVDTSVLHLAAAMGKAVWMLLPVSHDWRVDANDSLHTWYPSVRVFKQPTHGDWASVMAEVMAALDDLVDHLPAKSGQDCTSVPG